MTNQTMTNQKGFSLIEVLIGLTIGLIALLAVAQVFITFNKQRNTANQAMEAQSNGAMGLFLIQRDLQMAGFGLMNIQDCALIQWYWNPVGCNPAQGSVCGLQNPLSTQPVVITDGGANSDQIQINYALATSAAPLALLSQSQNTFGDAYNLNSTAGFAVGDMVVADVGGSCTMSQTSAKNDAALTLTHDATTQFGTPPAASIYNTTSQPAGATGGWDVGLVNNLLVNLGSYVSKSYQVANNNLQLAAFPQTATYNDVVEGVMFIKAQYGLDDGGVINGAGGTPGDGIVDEWVSGSTVITNTKQLLAVRVGLVARSPLLEKDPVVLQDSAGNTITALTVLPAITGGAGVTWAIPDTHYRYKVYYTVIPLRNVIWNK